ncbi:MAG TPA: O-antigen ligase family protein [Anaerolineae bacterium]|nr:O-antigen ligase family protein [Anaerolineae bacterium]HQK13159.1 O-antigen ligase family protein [Anaerolineae bacterium]
MIEKLTGQRWNLPRLRLSWIIVALALAGAAYLGTRPSSRRLILLGALGGGWLLLQHPDISPFVLIMAALFVPIEFKTGTEVTLNSVTLAVPVFFGMWIFHSIQQHRMRWSGSRVDRPLLLFLLAGLLSLLVGNVLWDPAIPRPSGFTMVQLGQWAIFAFSALAFWLPAQVLCSENGLHRLTFLFLGVGGGVALAIAVFGVGYVIGPVTTLAPFRTPFWVVLTGLAGGQILFNPSLTNKWRGFLILVMLAVLHYAFIAQREAVSNWVGVLAVLGVLVWLRFPRLRGWIVGGVMAMALLGILFPTLYNFAGGDDEWIVSGGSRLALIQRVIEVTLRNPITGLGPAAYRPYTANQPLVYNQAIWLTPKVNSHNNYVDIFAHTGLLGLALFLWFLGELGWLGWQLSALHRSGFVGGYVNGMFAAWVGSLVIMLLLDWMLPFVYNVGFPGFQASLLVWLFLGGLVAIEQLDKNQRSNV